jgi:inorganic pyrophosphatase
LSSLNDLSASLAQGTFHVVIECPRGSTTKIKYEPKLKAFVLSRPLPLGLSYPHDWGFVPGTRADDGDPVDALVLSEGTTFPGLVMAVRPLGLITLDEDSKDEASDSRKRRQRNDRIVAVPAAAPRMEWRSTDDLPRRMREEIELFFVNSTFFEQKNVRILGWEGPEQAMALVESKLRR